MDGTNSLSGGHEVSTMSHDAGITGSYVESWSLSAPVAYGEWGSLY